MEKVSKLPPKSKTELNRYKKVYVWELPVRIFHWVNAFAILTLFTTGLFIAFPIVGTTITGEAYYSFVMGWVRYIHFFAAFLFTINLIIRVSWFFWGNRYARSNPLKKEFWTGTFEVLKSYLFLKNKKKDYIGHNPMAELSYWIFIGLGSILMILTGFFMLFEIIPGTVLGSLFGWLPKIFGNSFSIRSLHHLVAWCYIIFTVIHVYMAFREDWLAKNGTISSIFTGYKTINQSQIKDEEKDNERKAN